MVFSKQTYLNNGIKTTIVDINDRFLSVVMKCIEDLQRLLNLAHTVG